MRKDQEISSRLRGALEREANNDLIDFFFHGNLSGFFRTPACGFFDKKSEPALAHPPHTSRSPKEGVIYDIVSAEVTDFHWLHDGIEGRIPVILKNPQYDKKLVEEFGIRNVLFAHHGIMFAAKWEKGSSEVACLRPVQIDYQEKLYQAYQKIYLGYPAAFANPAPIASL